MQDKRIRVGIAGFGDSGRYFNSPFIAANPHYEIKKVYERTSAKSKLLYPDVEVVRSFEELLLDDIDLVVLSTPNQLHYTMAKQALLAGKNVITDKPAAKNFTQVDELAQIAKDRGLVYTVYQNRRWDGPFLTAKAIIESGVIGRCVDYVVHFDRFVSSSHVKAWKKEEPEGTGALYDIAVHHIDQALCLFGSPEAVYSDLRIQRENVVAVDNAQVALYYPDSLKVLIKVSNTARIPSPYITVHATRGSYVKQGFDIQEKLLKSGRMVDENWGYEDEADWGMLDCNIDGLHYKGKVETLRSHWGGLYENLYRAIVFGEELEVKPSQVSEVLKIIEASIESSNEGKKIFL